MVISVLGSFRALCAYALALCILTVLWSDHASAHKACTIKAEFNVREADGTIHELNASHRSNATCTGRRQTVSIGNGKTMQAEIVEIPGHDEPLFVSRYALDDSSGSEDQGEPQEATNTEPVNSEITPDDVNTEAAADCVECALAFTPRPPLNRAAEAIEQQLAAQEDGSDEETEAGDGVVMSTPIQDKVCHLDSRRFGCRMHPVLDYVRQHDGIDMNSNGHPFNRIVVSSMEGKVVTRVSGKIVVRHCQSGKLIRNGRVSNEPCEIRMADGSTKTFTTLETMYRHVFLQSGKAAVGSAVEAGEVIAQAGNIGLGTGIHLHYEVHANGTPVDPLKFHRPSTICNNIERAEALYKRNSAGRCTNRVEAYQ